MSEGIRQSGVTSLSVTLLYLSLKSFKVHQIQPQIYLFHTAWEIRMHTQVKFVPETRKCHVHLDKIRNMMINLSSEIDVKQGLWQPHSAIGNMWTQTFCTEWQRQKRLRISHRRYLILMISYIKITFLFLFRNQHQIERNRKYFKSYNVGLLCTLKM